MLAACRVHVVCTLIRSHTIRQICAGHVFQLLRCAPTAITQPMQKLLFRMRWRNGSSAIESMQFLLPSSVLKARMKRKNPPAQTNCLLIQSRYLRLPCCYFLPGTLGKSLLSTGLVEPYATDTDTTICPCGFVFSFHMPRKLLWFRRAV